MQEHKMGSDKAKWHINKPSFTLTILHVLFLACSLALHPPINRGTTRAFS